MTDEDTKSAPVTVRVKAAPPAIAEFGLSESMLGIWFEVEGGGGLFPELPEPPPQPADSCRETRHARATIPLRRFAFPTDLFLCVSLMAPIQKNSSRQP